jgi:hypothetical protein
MHHNVKIDKVVTQQDRAAIVAKLPPEVSKPLSVFNMSFSACKSVAEFLDELDSVANVCQLMLKRLDKQKEK